MLNLERKIVHTYLEIKFSFSEKVIRICAIFLMILNFTIGNVKTMRKIFVAFSEKLNFNSRTEIEFKFLPKSM